jgi:hypothetical protein
MAELLISSLLAANKGLESTVRALKIVADRYNLGYGDVCVRL